MRQWDPDGINHHLGLCVTVRDFFFAHALNVGILLRRVKRYRKDFLPFFSSQLLTDVSVLDTIAARKSGGVFSSLKLFRKRTSRRAPTQLWKTFHNSNTDYNLQRKQPVEKLWKSCGKLSVSVLFFLELRH